MAAAAAVVVGGGSACAWRRVGGVASVASSLHPRERARAREEGRRTHDELGPALAAARRRWARWAMVTLRGRVASRRDRNLTWGRFRWPRRPTRALSLRVPGRGGCWGVDAAAVMLRSTGGGCDGRTFA